MITPRLITDVDEENSKPYPVDPAYRKPAVNNNPADWNIVKACQYGSLGRVVELVEHPETPYDVNKLDDEGVSILHWAAINNHRHIVLYLISKGAIVDRLAGNLMASPLHWAIREARINMMSLLIKHGADPNVKDKVGVNCLHVAVKDGHVNIILYLLSLGMDINERNDDGLTPLMLASIFNHNPNTLRILVNWGADPTIVDNKGNTVAHYAMEQGNYASIQHLDKLPNISWVKQNNEGVAPYEIQKIPWLAERVKEIAIKKDQLRGQTVKSNRWLKVCRQIVWSYGRPAAFGRLRKETLIEENFSLNLSYIMPFFVLFGITFLLQWNIIEFMKSFRVYSDISYFPWWIIPFKIVGILFIFYCLNNVLSLVYDKDHKNVMLFATAMAAKALFIFMYFVYVVRHTEDLTSNHWLFTVCTSIMLWLFYRCVRCDPGFVHPSLQYSCLDERNKFIRGVVERPKEEASVNNREFDPLKRFCTTCLILRPLRSKHCSMCDRCVAKFDHHCPWIYNCVGQNNHKWFLGYLLMIPISLVFFLFGGIRFYSHTNFCVISTSESAFHRGLLMIEGALWCNPGLVLCIILASLFLVWTLILLFVSGKQALWWNITTNERINSTKYAEFAEHAKKTNQDDNSNVHDCNGLCSDSPYNLGMWRNACDLLQRNGYCDGSTVDWRKVFDMDEVRNRGSDRDENSQFVV